MSLPVNEPLPPPGSNLPPARHRRNRRQLYPYENGEREAFLTDLARRITPTADFFIFSLLAGVVLVVAILTDAPAIFILAALLSPFMGPALGLGLATVVGSGRFFLQCLGGILLGSLIVFGCGALGGLAGRFIPGLIFTNSLFHTVFSWPDFLLLTVGAALATFQLVRNPNQRPLVASVAVAYELYIPIAVAGFGITSRAAGLWPDGLIVFLVNLAWTALVVTIVLVIMRLRPKTAFGYGLAMSIVLICLVILIALLGFGTAVSTQLALPTPISSATPLPTETVTPSLEPSATETLTPSLIPTNTETPTLTIEPTLAQAFIKSENTTGANIRESPNFGSKVIASVLNGYLVVILPDTFEDGTTSWVHVRLNDGREGWIVRDLLTTATPSPGW
jgi:uncharacterized membrane protein